MGCPILDKAWRISIPVPGAWWNIFMSLGKLKSTDGSKDASGIAPFADRGKEIRILQGQSLDHGSESIFGTWDGSRFCWKTLIRLLMFFCVYTLTLLLDYAYI